MRTNRLAREASPYLLQHAGNPVEWFPWGEEAFAEARRRDVPVLLSIGYAACHWCHVMAHESFEDAAVARLLNESFVNVKVDREERPDIDAIYMGALHALGEQGGWPLTMFLTPDGEPFWGGTYFPPEPRWGRPSFRQVLLGVSNAWRTRNEAVIKNMAALRKDFAASRNFGPPRASAGNTFAAAAPSRHARTISVTVPVPGHQGTSREAHQRPTSSSRCGASSRTRAASSSPPTRSTRAASP